MPDDEPGSGSLPPVAQSMDKASLLALASGESHDVDLSSVDLFEGWQNVVLSTTDGWILRFPRDASHAFVRECEVLELLRVRLPAEVPVIEWTGVRTRFAAYRTLQGVRLEPGEYGAEAERTSDRTAASMAQFLLSMHCSMSVEEVAALGIPTLGSDHLVEATQRHWSSVPAHSRKQVEAVMARFHDRWVAPVAATKPGAPTLHNDFHLGNMLFAEHDGALKAVWDFSCVEQGEPSYDFRYLFEDSWQLAIDVAGCYERIAESKLDLPAAALAGHFEAISDALVEGRDVSEVMDDWSRRPLNGLAH
ncbi:phosphotransferase (plasmid) [Mycobacterium sp. SMC-8]|uniref:phosphotransferase family protein n=1 Tax=Mycobacterium sp. SMC-8 TaxID=2857060 RepID=UPI0021B28AB4|nr:phosphotransferase [Mycobacterium sp. SMC-8]UXA15836.1 phosphotransferase [Mycobacterium sp. SMC-8]